MSFDALKKNRTKALDKLAAQINKTKEGGSKSYVDDRYWRLTRGTDGNGSAVIRFLPAPANEDNAFVQVWSHAFQGPTGKWYINKSLTTIGKDDPVSDANKILWDSGIEANKDLVRKRKRKMQYVSNILVVDDPANPENNGQVKLFEYGKKIFDKVNEAMFPEFDGEESINPFDMWEGANFKLRVRKYEGHPNYDKSEFAGQSAISEDEDVLRQIYDKLYSLQEVIDPKNFETYDKLKERLDDVLGNGPARGGNRAAPEVEDDEIEYKPKARERAPVDEQEAPARRAPAKAPAAPSVDDGDEDDLSFFEGLAKG